MKFTKEIKNNWLRALKSGKYIQGFASLIVKPDSSTNFSGKVEHCCIGVLGDITEGLSNDLIKKCNSNSDPYYFLTINFTNKIVTNLATKNDTPLHTNTVGKQDYSNVIPIIENLKTVD